MDSPSKFLNLKEITIFSMGAPLIVIFVSLSVNKNFFNIDDAVNEYLPFFTQMGRIWSSGRFPFLTDNTFMAGNAVVELSHCVFAPQSILASLLAWQFEYKQIASIFLAFFNMTVICASCLVISKQYNLRRTWAYLFGAFCIIQPEFLFINCRSWYNGGIAQAWALASIATFLLLSRKMTIRNFLLHFFSIIFLLSTAWLYAIFAYAIFVVLFLIFHRRKPFVSAPLAILIIANVLAVITALPLYSEYVFNSDLHDRFFTLGNWKNFLVFPWSSEFLTFLPTYFDFVPWFGGYHFFPLPCAFSTILAPLIFFNRKILTAFTVRAEIKFMMALILCFFICSQLPSYMFSMRCSFRFLPFFAFALCLTSTWILTHVERKNSRSTSYLLCVGLCWLLAVSKSVGQDKYFIYLQFISLALLLAVWYMDRKQWQHPFPWLFLTFVVLVVLLCDINWTNYPYLSNPIIYRNMEFPADFNRKGYVFSLGLHAYDESIKSFTNLYFNRSGFYNIRTINGYTPLGYKNWHKFLPSGGWQLYKSQEALDVMLAPVGESEMCRAQAWRISTFVIPEEIAKKNKDLLEKCGYQIGAADAKPMAYASLPPKMTKGWEKLPPVSYPPLEGIIHESHNDTFDRIFIPPHDKTLELVFPRLYWHGFRAYLNGKRLEVGRDESGFLISVTIPAGLSGTLEFSFFPETWRYLWICPLFSLVCALFVLLYIKKRKPGGFWTLPQQLPA